MTYMSFARARWFSFTTSATNLARQASVSFFKYAHERFVASPTHAALQIQVSYRLAPSHTSMVLLRALSEERVSTRDEPQALEQAKLGGRYAHLPKREHWISDVRWNRKKAFMTSLDGIPSIILT
jgi:hypothetical protein